MIVILEKKDSYKIEVIIHIVDSDTIIYIKYITDNKIKIKTTSLDKFNKKFGRY